MKVLLISHKPPFPTDDGGKRASLALYDDLVSQVSVTWWIIESDKHPADVKNLANHTKDNYKLFFADLSVSLFGALAALFSGVSYNFDRFNLTSLNKAFEKEYKGFDLVLFDGLFACAPVLSVTKNDAPLFWLRSHNVEHEIWTQRAVRSNSVLKKWYFNRLSNQLKLIEKRVVEKMDRVLAISREDADYFKQQYKTETEEYEVTIQFKKSIKAPLPIFGHLGAMNWAPNRESAEIFINQWAPYILKQLPEASFHIAGSHMDTFDWKSTIPIKNWGYVPIISDFFHHIHILLAPIQQGAGVKIKILEALNYGCWVISSPQGAEGIDQQRYPHLLIARSEEDLTEILQNLSKNADFVAPIYAQWEKSRQLFLSSKKAPWLRIEKN